MREVGLPLEVDVAARLATDTVGNRFALDAVLDVAKRVTVMAYRDHAEGADGILDFSRATRVACFRHATRFRVGVETQPAEQAGGSRQTNARGGPARAGAGDGRRLESPDLRPLLPRRRGS